MNLLLIISHFTVAVIYIFPRVVLFYYYYSDNTKVHHLEMELSTSDASMVWEVVKWRYEIFHFVYVEYIMFVASINVNEGRQWWIWIAQKWQREKDRYLPQPALSSYRPVDLQYHQWAHQMDHCWMRPEIHQARIQEHNTFFSQQQKGKQSQQLFSCSGCILTWMPIVDENNLKVIYYSWYFLGPTGASGPATPE